MTLITTYFGPVSWYKELLRTSCDVPMSSVDEFLHDVIDTKERFQKQTIRTRCRIATANGVQTLSVPVEAKNGVPIKDVRISEHGNWRHLHWQALATAYGNSPFFEYYQDDIRPFFENKWDNLCEFNSDITRKMLELIGFPLEKHVIEQHFLQSHAQASVGKLSCLDMISTQERETLKPYYQVFQSRHGFIEDLSILDLLFNMGPESIKVLLDGSIRKFE